MHMLGEVGPCNAPPISVRALVVYMLTYCFVNDTMYSYFVSACMMIIYSLLYKRDYISNESHSSSYPLQ